MDLWAVSDSYRYGIHLHRTAFGAAVAFVAIPDEDPPGNQVTTRAEKLPLLSHGRRRFALMLTPRSIPGEFVSPRILRHAPSCYILVTMRAVDAGDCRFAACAISGSFLRLGIFRLDGVPPSAPAPLTQTVGRLVMLIQKERSFDK
jgi:hypothetical protein